MSETPNITTKEQKGPHRFKKGESGNPNGRPKGIYGPLKEEFLNALKKVEKATKVNFFEHLVTQALLDNTVLIAVAKKMLPDLSESFVEGDGFNIIIMPARPKEDNGINGQTNGLDSGNSAVPDEVHNQ